MTLSPDHATFCLLSFEGPDPYAIAGGLGVRMMHLAGILAHRGFDTHLIFVGDPHLPGREEREGGRLTLHRWCQWISQYHPAGVYDGEQGKMWDYSRSAPPFVLNQIVRPALASGRLPVILAEEWHTAQATIQVHEQLQTAGLRKQCVIFWNANNNMSFEAVDWPRLNAAAQLTTVSRYMKHLMWEMGLNPLVIPNGIPSELLEPVDPAQVASLTQVLSAHSGSTGGGGRIMFFKVGRFDPAKRWMMAVEAAAYLKAKGYPVVFPLRGGIEPHGQEVLQRARQLGLTVADVNGQPHSWSEVLALLQQAAGADVLNLRFFMPQEWLRPFYAAADAVLANSGHEPFGLVGLEAMAAGGLAFTGATGEEYALNNHSAVALDTDQPEEIVAHVVDLYERPQRAQALREGARAFAAAYTWDQALAILLEKIEFVAYYQRSTRRPRTAQTPWMHVVRPPVKHATSIAA